MKNLVSIFGSQPFLPLSFLLLLTMILPGCEAEEYNYLEEYSRYTATEHIGVNTVRFAIAVPNKYYAHPSPTPLVLALHYGGTVSDSSGLWILSELVLPALGELEAICVAPVSPAQTSWTTSICERVIFGLLDTIINNMEIDTRKIIITGYSMGATATWYYVNKYSNFFTAALPVSGDPTVLNLNNLGETPIYAIHSQADEVIPYEPVKNLINTLQAQGMNVQLKTVKSYSHNSVTRFAKPLRELLPWLRQQLP